jgi:hypothetical protein
MGSNSFGTTYGQTALGHERSNVPRLQPGEEV